MTLGLWSFLHLLPPTLFLVHYLYYLLMLPPWGAGWGMQPFWVLSPSNFPVCQFCPPSTSDKTSVSGKPTGRKLYSAMFPLPFWPWLCSFLWHWTLGLQIGNATVLSFLLLFPRGRMRHHVSLEDVDKHELEKQIKGILAPWYIRGSWRWNTGQSHEMTQQVWASIWIEISSIKCNPKTRSTCLLLIPSLLSQARVTRTVPSCSACL